MKINPDDFSPSVWTTTDEGRPARVLICSKRFCRSPENPPTWVFHPVAIVMGSTWGWPCAVIYGLRDDSHLWGQITLEEAGLNSRSARYALAEAWRGVESVTPSFPDMRNFHFSYKGHLLARAEQCSKDQDFTMLRNVNAWMNWHQWERRGISKRERAKELSAMGFKTTEKQLERAAGERGL